MFSDPRFPPHDGEAVVTRIADLIGRAREAGTPVFYVQHAGGPGDELEAGTPGFAYRAAIAPEPEDSVTVKRLCNSFQDTDFDAKLKAAGITHLIVCGMQTEYCVDTAVRASYERGYKVTLVGDAHTTFDNGVVPASAIVAHHNKTLDGSFSTVRLAADIRFSG
jgi:nicotinamidase-related amidase